MSSHVGAPSNSRNYHKLKGAIKTNTDKLADDILEMLNQYTDEVSEQINDTVKGYAQEGCNALKETRQPPATASGTAKPLSRRDWKKYANSWQVETREGDRFVNCTIHNKKHYRLTHLLEKGHATKNGTRTRAFQHIEPISNELEELLPKAIKNVIEKGG